MPTGKSIECYICYEIHDPYLYNVPLVLLHFGMSLLVKKNPNYPYTIITLDAFGIEMMNIEESIINPTSQFFCIIMQLS